MPRSTAGAAPAPCVIFDSHHPKEYLGIRQLGRRCRENGVDVVWTAREKDVLVDLMRQDGLDPVVLTTARESLAAKLGELVAYDLKLTRLARRKRPAALLGKAISMAHVGCLLRIPSILINDDSAAANPQYRFLGYPFATRIVTAECLAEDYGSRQRTYPGLMELAYLHPNVFTPDPGIRTELGVAPETRLFVLRLAAFSAYHDVGQSGLSRALIARIVERLSSKGRVYIVSEAPLVGELAQFRMPLAATRLHHLLAASDLVIGDGLTVVVEAALLGTPAIAVGSYIGKHTYTEALEHRFGLMHGFRPDREAEICEMLEHVLTNPEIGRQWEDRRWAMLGEWCDPTDVYWDELSRLIGDAPKTAPGLVPASTPSSSGSGVHW